MKKRLLGSVLHAGAVLELFSPVRNEWGITEISSALGLPKSTVHALVASLLEIGLLERSDNRRVRLGHKLLGFSETVLSGSEIFNSMRDLLNDLMTRFGRSVYLAVKDGDHVVYINRLQGSSAVPASLGSAGPTLPVHASAAGKMLLAHQPMSDARRILDSRGLPRLTQHTITTEAALSADLAVVRKQGFALSEGEYVSGLYCVAAPVLNAQNQVVAAIGFGATADDFGMNKDALIKEAIRAGQRASREQGWRGRATS